MSLSMSQAIPIKGIEDLFRQLAGAVIGAAVDDAIAADVREWIGTAAPGTSTSIGRLALDLAVESGDVPRWTFNATVPD